MANGPYSRRDPPDGRPLGADTDEILAGLGISDEKLAELREPGPGAVLVIPRNHVENLYAIRTEVPSGTTWMNACV